MNRALQSSTAGPEGSLGGVPMGVLKQHRRFNLPARDHCGESDPRPGGRWWILACTISPCPVAHQRRKNGGRSLHFLPLQTRRRARRGHAGRCPATVVAADAGNPCQPVPHKAFQARPRPQQRGALPSEREALWWSKACAPREPPTFVAVSPIRRHVLDPGRRKSSFSFPPSEPLV